MTFSFEADICKQPYEDGDEWYFARDLRRYFNDHADNHDIEFTLESRKLLKFSQCDTEISCLWVYFKTKKQAQKFLEKLNAQPEIAGYTPEPEIWQVLEDLENFLKEANKALAYLKRRYTEAGL